MLGLTEQIHRNPVGVGLTVANHENFRGARDHIDADRTEHITFGSSDIGVARSDNLINRRNRFSTVGHCGDRLSSADGVALLNAGKRSSSQNQLIGFAARSRNHHHDSADTGHVSRHSVHQNGRRVSGLTARDVQTDRVQRDITNTELGSVFFGDRPALTDFMLMERTNSLSGGLKRLFLIFRKRLERFFKILFGQKELFHAFGVHMIEAIGVFKHRLVASFTHILDNRLGSARNLRINRGVHSDQFGELRSEVRILCIQSSNDHFFTVFSKISISGKISCRFNFIAVCPTISREDT